MVRETKRPRSWTWMAILAVAAFRGGPDLPAQEGTPPGADPDVPEARRSSRVDTLHGVAVPAPYRWMEELDSDEVERWARAHDERARSYTHAVPLRDEIRHRTRSAARVVRYGTPTVRDGRYFYPRFLSRGGPLQLLGLELRDGRDAPAGTLISGETDVGDDERLVMTRPGPRGRLVAYGVSAASSRWMEVRIGDVATGADRPDTVRHLVRGRSSVSWTADGAGFFYDRFDAPEGDRRIAAVQGERIAYHRLGTAPGRDVVVAGGPDAGGERLGHSVSGDGRWLVVTSSPPGAAGNRILVADLGASGSRIPDRGAGLSPLVEDDTDTFTFLGSRDAELFFHTDREAERGRVVSADLSEPAGATWTEVVPEAEHTITTWPPPTAAAGRLVLGYLVDARTEVRLFHLDGTPDRTVELPRLGSIWSGFAGRPDDEEIFYTLSGAADPGTVFRMDPESGASTPYLTPDVGHDVGAFVTEQVFYTARDGARIPMFLVRHRDASLSEPRPVWMYGYAFGWPAAPWYQPHMVTWMAMGGVFAVPNTRGGLAYGREWDEAGSGHQKQTAIDDYVDAALWLSDEGYTTRGLMVANASSAGGAVAGAAAVQRPDAFGAVILDYPLLDMLRYHRFTVGRSWTAEYGTAAESADFRALLAYSPVHNAERGRCYPPTMVSPGELDETTPPLHAYKFVAALRHAQTCDAPILLRVARGAGHSAGRDADAAVDLWSDQLAFLVRTLSDEGWELDWLPDP